MERLKGRWTHSRGDGDAQGGMETFAHQQRLPCADRAHSSQLQLCPGPNWHHIPDLCPLSQGSPQHSHGRTYWDPRKPSWGGAGPPAGQGTPRLSSLLLLLPPRRMEEPGGPCHCPSCPPAPQSWGVCCSRRAAQKGAKREREPSKTIPETTLNVARTGSAKGDRNRGLGTAAIPELWTPPCTPGMGIHD